MYRAAPDDDEVVTGDVVGGPSFYRSLEQHRKIFEAEDYVPQVSNPDIHRLLLMMARSKKNWFNRVKLWFEQVSYHHNWLEHPNKFIRLNLKETVFSYTDLLWLDKQVDFSFNTIEVSSAGGKVIYCCGWKLHNGFEYQTMLLSPCSLLVEDKKRASGIKQVQGYKAVALAHTVSEKRLHTLVGKSMPVGIAKQFLEWMFHPKVIPESAIVSKSWFLEHCK